MKLFEHHTTLSQELVKPWLYKTAHHAALNALRSRKRRQAWHQRAKEKGSLPLDYEAGVDPERQMIAWEEAQAQEQEQAQVEQILAQLSSRQALVLRLRYSGLRYNEIADVVGVSPTSISQILVRAKKAFQRAYEATHQTPDTGKERSQA